MLNCIGAGQGHAEKCTSIYHIGATYGGMTIGYTDLISKCGAEDRVDKIECSDA